MAYVYKKLVYLLVVLLHRLVMLYLGPSLVSRVGLYTVGPGFSFSVGENRHKIILLLLFEAYSHTQQLSFDLCS